MSNELAMNFLGLLSLPEFLGNFLVSEKVFRRKLD
jgi:hypothetical protein